MIHKKAPENSGAFLFSPFGSSPHKGGEGGLAVTEGRGRPLLQGVPSLQKAPQELFANSPRAARLTMGISPAAAGDKGLCPLT
ncbi:MAG: hypothetical protein IJ825_00730, partial [Oscillospiraceae bacterium]|nr:hypothetical protein [Oscillospiraceae bacterium]